MRILISLFIGACLVGSVAHAETIHLKNGNVVEGKVIEQTADALRIDIGGTTLTYYQDEIASVDAQAVEPLAAPVSAPAADAPAAAEAPAAAPVVAEPVEAPAAEPVAAAEVPAAVPVQASEDELAGMGKEALINKFVDIYGVKGNMQANFDQMTSTLKPDQAEAFRNSVKVDDIVRELLPIYDKHFSEEDLRTYIRFYGSAEGKKLIQTLPLLMKDSVEVSMKYLEAHLPESLKQAQPAEEE